ncbi:hypothetical protein Tdes44962_MAKER04683 [Teratosphaeria destructans]|uniref:Uncharacterized protein n=1 Tax=Teratosphaeria destructans TaxID=418781 RepID=A0A9W7W036_9PEZI|nr:hypothetical protein Tdes44962_MAKER04683 [Teratosphaeria destructans]
MHSAFVILASLAALPAVLAQPSPTPVPPAFPPSCQTACADTQSIINQCTSQRINDDINAGLRGDWKKWDDFNDTAYASCLCSASNAAADFPTCRDCLRDLPGDDHLDELNDLINRCNFASATSPANTTPTPTPNSSGSAVTTISGSAVTPTPTTPTPTTPGAATQTINAGSRAQLPLWAAGVGAAVAGLVL